jgi:hypothetical protein
MEKVAIKGSGGASGETFNVVSGLNNMVMSSPGDANGKQTLWLAGVQQDYVFNLLGGQFLGGAGFSNWEQASQGLERLNIVADSIFFSIGNINADGGNSIDVILEIYDSSGNVLESQTAELSANSVYTMVFLNGTIGINQPLSLGIKADPLDSFTNAYVVFNGWSFGLE